MHKKFLLKVTHIITKFYNHKKKKKTKKKIHIIIIILIF